MMQHHFSRQLPGCREKLLRQRRENEALHQLAKGGMIWPCQYRIARIQLRRRLQPRTDHPDPAALKRQLHHRGDPHRFRQCQRHKSATLPKRRQRRIPQHNRRIKPHHIRLQCQCRCQCPAHSCQRISRQPRHQLQPQRQASLPDESGRPHRSRRPMPASRGQEHLIGKRLRSELNKLHSRCLQPQEIFPLYAVRPRRKPDGLYTASTHLLYCRCQKRLLHSLRQRCEAAAVKSRFHIIRPRDPRQMEIQDTLYLRRPHRSHQPCDPALIAEYALMGTALMRNE